MACKNSIMIVLDSLQFNYLGCYGNTWIQTPNFDEFARESSVFENAYTEGLPTIPCRRAMMTGRYTLATKGWGPLDPDDTTISDLCWGRGIHAALIFDTGPMNLPKYSFTRGYHDVIFKHGHEMDHYFYLNDKQYHLDAKDYYEPHHVIDAKTGKPRSIFATAVEEELDCYLAMRQRWRGDHQSYVGTVSQAAIEWIEKVDKTHPFMLWIDSFDPHEPWAPPSVWENTPCPYNPDYKGKDLFLPLMGDVEGLYTEDELHHIRMLYAECVTLCDKWIGKFLDKVRSLGLWNDTLIIISSDHGEPMGNGEHGHGIMRKCRPWPYEELAHVPLLIHYPGHGEGKRFKAFAQSCDIAPTIADFLGIHTINIKHGKHDLPVCSTEDFQGKSLLPIMRGEIDKVRDFAIAGWYGSSWSIYTEDYSYFHWLKPNVDFEEFAVLAADAAGSLESLISTAKDTYKAESNDEIWTCTPGSERIVPDGDELYDRKTDPFQLKNIITQKPEVAKDLLKTLREFMSSIKAS